MLNHGFALEHLEAQAMVWVVNHGLYKLGVVMVPELSQKISIL